MKRIGCTLNQMSLIVLASAFWIGSSSQVQGADPNTLGRSEILRKEIMELQIQPLFLSITSVSRMDLDELITNLERLEIPSAPAKAKAEPSSVSAVPELSETEMEDTALLKEEISEPATVLIETALSHADPEWLKQIDAVDEPLDPMSLGDVLFGIGQIERAERFYQMVLQRTHLPEDLNWQWAMYQRANCLRKIRPSEAQSLYQELITRAPGSSWSEAAAAQKAMLDWYHNIQKTEIKRLIRDPNDLP